MADLADGRKRHGGMFFLLLQHVRWPEDILVKTNVDGQALQHARGPQQLLHASDAEDKTAAEVDAAHLEEGNLGSRILGQKIVSEGSRLA